MTFDPSPRPGVLGRQFIDVGDERRAAVMRILEAGWKRASDHPEVHADAGEVEITERLIHGMRAALKAKVVQWSKKMTVQRGTESSSSPDAPKPDGRLDISVFFTEIREEYDEHDPHAIVECKRIAGNRADLCRQYVVEGIDRFVTRKYAGNHADGFMAGYLLAGDAEAAVAGVNRRLSRKGRQPERLESSTILDVPWARSSRHPRPAPAGSISLHHAFFGLRPAPRAGHATSETEP